MLQMEMQTAFADFLARHPRYAETSTLDRLRTEDYSRLDDSGHVYLDYTGGGLYGASQLREHHRLLAEGVFGNPHSHNPTSLAATELVERAREAVFRFFRADPAEYDVIFTPNASGALKLVGEAYPFSEGARFLVSYDNHNSVNGIREFAARAGAEVVYVPVRNPDLRLDPALVERGLGQLPEGAHGLFAYPAQSNFSGVQHPTEWIDEARDLGWDVLLGSTFR
jgi:molybdenum cofactor sulfurtransferase